MGETGYDLVIRSGTLATAGESFVADLAIAGGRIAAIGENLPPGRDEIDACGLLVLPGGVDAHCHVDEPPYAGARHADDFRSASRAAACGGTTTILPFANQVPDRPLRQSLEDYHRRAEGRSLIDYAFHLIIRQPTASVVGQELPSLIAEGYTSFKVFMTYPGYMLEDEPILELLDLTRREGALLMVHAENGHCVHWMTERLERAGDVGLGAHGRAAPPAVEREATHRAIALAEVAGARVLLVHVSSAQALEQIRWAQDRGLPVLAETCPQYLFLGQADLERPGWEAAKFICSPPPRGPQDADALWRGIAQGAFQLVSSDHCAYRLDGREGKRAHGDELHFRKVANGVPGIETRLPLLFHEGVGKGRLTLQQFVAATSTNPARIYGLYPRKGGLAIGGDADIAIWDPAKRVTIRHAELHDACDYTPYEGRELEGWPVVTLSRGERIWDRGRVSEAYGRGRFLPCDRLGPPSS
ncbi:dihydropyrimidinase [Tistlia consotensis]|uniref:D-hydantoinase n=1 Tax=Tistlia consotensis USBA 355 TaxID=560819 RepID=A0A1Y6CFC5_9PROT|nr:dihydropyrimidinase [Tistlia consotensis]SMF58325.1 dihydropyrimidinase [Tistlia consotensis USBA 355]SNR63298.1 dihydropyrimidinase [Tistlia consotensis]